MPRLAARIIGDNQCIRRQLNVLEKLLGPVLLFEEKREKDTVNYALIQLYADLQTEELLHETGTHCFFLLKVS
jgi:hypothetical protein